VNRLEFQRIYRTYGPAVRARCRAICGNHADADEALQETFVRAWKNRKRFDGRQPLAWLQTIARNTSIDLLRKRRPWDDDPVVWLKIPAKTVSPEDRADVEGLFRELKAEDVAMLRLRYVEEWRVREIAEHLNTSARTVRRRLEEVEARARVLLRVAEVHHVA